jgi:hypothetical protein
MYYEIMNYTNEMDDLLRIALDELDTLTDNYYLALSDLEHSPDNVELITFIDAVAFNMNNKRDYIDRLISLGATLNE